MNSATRIYLSFAVLTAAATMALQLAPGFPMLTQEALLGVVCLVALGVISEALSIQVNIGSGNASSNAASSIAFIPLLASAILFPNPTATIAALVMSGIAEFAIRRRQLLKAAFNVAQIVLSTALASVVYRSLGELFGTSPIALIAQFAGLAGTFFFTNQLLCSLALTFIYDGRLSSTFARVVGGSGANLLYDFLVSPIVILIVLLFNEWKVPGLLVGVFLLLLVRHSYMTVQRLQQANTDVLRVLIKTIETRDPYTSGHSVRVSLLAKAIAEDLDLTASQVDDIETAALLHDIGKIDTVYADIICKQSGLTDSERGVIVTHAAHGADFLRTISSFKEHVILSVRHHHERWDGTGYPDRMSGSTIPLAARIIMLCDSIDAMLSDRPYRRALSVEQVRAELLRCSGSQFDPNIVRVILQRNTLERAAKLVAPTRHAVPMLSVG
jgi:putative nucleotidyltransferase with HDIG domain